MKTVQGSAVRFLLKDPRADRATLVSLVFRYGSQRFVYSTGQFVEPFQWDVDSQRAYTNQKNRAERSAHETVNAHIERHRAALVQIVANLRLANVPFDNAILKQHLDTATGRDRPTPIVEAKPTVLAEAFTAYIARFVAEGQDREAIG